MDTLEGVEYQSGDRYDLNTGEIVVRAGGRANIHVQPSVAFRPCELSVRSVHVRRSNSLPSCSESVDSFTVDEVLVGKVTVFRDLKPPRDRDRVRDEQVIPLRGAQVAFPWMFVTVSVTNHDTSDRVFRAVVSGPLENS